MDRAVVIYYVAHTTTRRNLAAIRAAGFRVLISAAAPQHWDARGFRYCLDPGAWHYFHHGKPFDEDAYEAMVDKLAAGADWLLLPDIVAGGLPSLDLSTRWLNRGLGSCPMVLIAVQDGLEPEHLAPLVGPSVGIFLGGSTEWKLARMADWGRFCAQVPCRHPLWTPQNDLMGCWYHVARVNTVKRMSMAIAAGATSADGSSASKWSVTVPLLHNAARQTDMLSPRGFT